MTGILCLFLALMLGLVMLMSAPEMSDVITAAGLFVFFVLIFAGVLALIDDGIPCR